MSRIYLKNYVLHFGKMSIICLNDFRANYLRSCPENVVFKTELLSHYGIRMIISTITGSN